MVETTDVLIIGAGPAGLMCANALGGLGVRTIIIDRRSELVTFALLMLTDAVFLILIQRARGIVWAG